MTEVTPTTPGKKNKPRSPSYPGIDLQTAIGRARALFDAEGRHAAHVDTVFAHWGIKPRSGNGGVILAALIRFGLVTDEGAGDTRRARLSNDGLEILLGDETSAKRNDAIRAAALRPTIHAEVWEKYEGSLPSDPNLRLWLIREKGFTTGGADEFIGQLRRTIAFAGLSPSDRVEAHEKASTSEATQSMSVAAAKVDRPVEKPAVPVSHYQPDRTQVGRTVLLPLGAGWATLDAPFPLTEEAWGLMLKVLEAMKPGLVQKPVTETTND